MNYAPHVHSWFARAFLLIALPIALLANHGNHNVVCSQEAAIVETQESVALDRFLSILEKAPHRGTAFDQVIQHHIHGGTLDRYVASLVDRTKKNPDDGVPWMIIGLIENERRNDSAAIAALAEAEKRRPNDAEASFCRGQLLLRQGEHKQAIEAFESAIGRSPSRILLVQIIEHLGRCHERLHQSEEAERAWKRLDEQFSDDLRIQERIAVVQNQEGAFQNALKRYERLEKLATDSYQRIQYRMEAAQLRLKLGDKERGLAELQAILSELNPDAWLYKDCQKKLEETFLNAHDLNGLIQFYEKRVASEPNDLDAMVRLSKKLYSAGKTKEAIGWGAKAASLAPSRSDLRKLLIDMLVADQQWPQADDNYRQLVQMEPNNMDFVKAWGMFTLSDPSRDANQTKQVAAEIWQSILVHRPKDAESHARIAELLAASQMYDQAERLFKKAIEIEPQNPKYVEYLGDFYFGQNRKDKAIEVWESMLVNAPNSWESLLQLAEIYHRVRMFSRAADRAEEACKLAPSNLPLRLRTAEFERKCNRIDEAIANLSVAETLADRESEREHILSERLDILEASHRLKPESVRLAAALEESKDASQSQWQLLVRYLVRLRQWSDADKAVNRAIALNERNVASLRSVSEIAEALEDVNRAIGALKKLVELDPRKSEEYLTRASRLQMQAGDKKAAQETARKIVEGNPTRMENHLFLADVCFQAKDYDAGIEVLRNALRIRPDSDTVINALSGAFSKQGKHQEAIELNLKKFHTARTLEERLELIAKLVTHYRNQGTMSSLVDLLDRERKDPNVRRDLTLCLAHVHASEQDYPNARSLLEELLSIDARDTQTLERLVSVCSSNRELDAAVEYQRQLVAIDPQAVHETLLASLLRQQGRMDESKAISLKVLKNEPDDTTLIRTLDDLYHRGESELVKQTAESLLQKEPENWQLLYRLGLAYVELNRVQDAKAIWERILAMDVHHNSTSFQNQAKASPGGDNPKQIATTLETICIQSMQRIAQGQLMFNSSDRWNPKNFGELRMASLAWLVYCDDMGAPSPVLRDRKAVPVLRELSRTQLLDLLAQSKFQRDGSTILKVMEILVEDGNKDVLPYLLQAIQQRYIADRARMGADTKQLSESQIAVMVKAYDAVREPIVLNWTKDPAEPPYVAPPALARQMGRFNRSQNRMIAKQVGFVKTVIDELVYANKPADAETFLEKLCHQSSTAYQLETLCEYLLTAKRMDQIPSPLLRWLDIRSEVFQKGADAASVSILSESDPVDFVIRFLDATSDSISWESKTTLVHSVLNLENLRLRVCRFDSTEADSIIYSFGHRQQLESNPRNKLAYRPWPGNFVSSAVKRLLQMPRLTAPTDKWTAFYESRINDAQEYERPFEAMRLALFQEVKSTEERNATLQRLLLEIGARPEFSLQAAVALTQFGLTKEAGVLATNAEVRDKKESLIRDLILIAAAKWNSDSDRLNDLLAKFDFKSLEPDSVRSMATLLPESSKLAVAAMPSLFQANPYGMGGPPLASSRPRPGTIPPGTLPPGSMSPGTKPPATASSAGRPTPGPFPTNRPTTGVPGMPSTGTASTTPGPFPTNRPTGVRGMPSTAPSAFPTAAKPAVQIDPMVTELSRLEAIDVQAAINLARSIVSKPANLAVPIRPYTLQYMTRTKVPSQMTSWSGRGKNRDPARDAAFTLLKKQNELNRLVDEIQKGIEASPSSFLLYERLAECQESLANHDAADIALSQAIVLRPDSVTTRHYQVEHSFRNGMRERALDHLFAFLSRDSAYALSVIAHYKELIKSPEIATRVLEEVHRSDLRSTEDTSTIAMSGTILMKTPLCFEIGASILEKQYESFPGSQHGILHNVYLTTGTDFPRMLNFTAKTFVPNRTIQGSPWAGFQDQPGHFSGGEGDLLQAILQSHPPETIAKEMEAPIGAAVESMPNWLGGKLLMAVLLSNRKEQGEAEKFLDAIVDTEGFEQGCPKDAILRLGKELGKIPRHQPLAIRLLSSSNSLGASSFDSHAPKFALAKIWADRGNRAKANEVLLADDRFGGMRMTGSTSGLSRRSGREESDFFRNVGSLAHDYLSLGMPIESYRCFTSPYFPRHESDKGMKDKGIEASIRFLENMPADRAVEELLFDRTTLDSQNSVLELMLELPAFSQVVEKPMESIVHKELMRHTMAGKAKEIEKKLNDLWTLHPNDFSVALVRARWMLETNIGDSKEAIRELSQIAAMEKSNLDPNDIAATWLVARKCYQLNRHLEIAERFAANAYQVFQSSDKSQFNMTTSDRNVSFDQPKNESADSLLLEWGKSLIENGNTADGKAKLEELLKRRPSAKPFVSPYLGEKDAD